MLKKLSELKYDLVQKFKNNWESRNIPHCNTHRMIIILPNIKSLQSYFFFILFL